MLGSHNLTYPTPEAKREAEQTIPGMAHFATTGPEGTTCGGCVHRGYLRQSSRGKWSERLNEYVYKSYRTYACAMFKKLGGRHGPVLPKKTPSCKYFQAKP